jgi:glycosyltransferase involved in cell wall biosynthesis
MRRGAELFAFDLTAALAREAVEQLVVFLHRGREPVLRFTVPHGPLPRGAWSVPGVNIDPATLGGLRRAMAEFRPTLVQAHGGEPLKYAVAAGAGPILYRRIAAAPPAVRGGGRRAVYGWLMRRARRVVAVSEPIRRETVEVFGVPAGRVTTIPRGVDPRRVAPVRGRAATRSALELPPAAAVLLSLGALTWEKDPDAQLDVARRVAPNVPGFVHLMAGDGPLRPAVERAIARDRLGGRVRLLGTRADVGDLLAAADVILLASRTEGMPGVLVEAGMASRASAAYDVGGVGEVVLDGDTGRLVPPGDVDGLADAVASLLTDEGLRSRMGEAARRRCLERFEIDRVAASHLTLYRQIAVHGRRP